MRKYHNTLLTTAAAVALVVSTGLASAQDRSKSETPGATPRAAQSKPMGKAPTGAPAGAAQARPSGGEPATAQEQRPGGTGAQQKPSSNPATAQEQERRGGTGAQKPSSNPATAQEQRRSGTGAQTPSNKAPATAEQRSGRGNTNTAEQKGGRNGLNGLQGNASGTNVQLTEQQRATFRRTIIDARGAPKVGHVDFDVTVGTVVPRDRIHIVPVPDSLVQIEPGWRGFLYFVYTDEIVVVNPSDMRIVAVLLV